MQYQMRAMNQKMAHMQQENESQIQKNSAQYSSKIDQLEQEVGILQNQLEATNEINNRLSDKNSSLETNITTIANNESVQRKAAISEIKQQQLAKETELEAMRQKLIDQQDKLAAIQQARIRDAERKAKEAKLVADKAKEKSNQARRQGIIKIEAEEKKIIKKSSASKPKPVIKEKPTAQPVVAQKPKTKPVNEPVASEPQNIDLSEQEQLSQAIKEFDKSRYQSALDKLALIENSKDENIVVKRTFYEAKSHAKLGNTSLAMYSYNEITRRFPSHPTASKAMLEQAYYFNSINQTQTVQVLCEGLIKKFPNSPEATSAKELLKNVAGKTE